VFGIEAVISIQALTFSDFLVMSGSQHQADFSGCPKCEARPAGRRWGLLLFSFFVAAAYPPTSAAFWTFDFAPLDQAPQHGKIFRYTHIYFGS